jgi:hypothetical protein
MPPRRRRRASCEHDVDNTRALFSCFVFARQLLFFYFSPFYASALTKAAAPPSNRGFLKEGGDLPSRRGASLMLFFLPPKRRREERARARRSCVCVRVCTWLSDSRDMKAVNTRKRQERERRERGTQAEEEFAHRCVVSCYAGRYQKHAPTMTQQQENLKEEKNKKSLKTTKKTGRITGSNAPVFLLVFGAHKSSSQQPLVRLCFVAIGSVHRMHEYAQKGVCAGERSGGVGEGGTAAIFVQ